MSTTIQLDRKRTADVTSKLGKLISKNKDRPINQTILIQTIGNFAYFTGCDGQTTLHMSVPLENSAPNMHTLAHGDLLCSVIAKMRDEVISLTFGSTHLQIKGNNAEFEIGTFDPNEYPYLDRYSVEGSKDYVWEVKDLPKDQIKRAFDKIDFCVSPKDMTKAVAGALMHQNNDTLRVVAANRNMMAFQEIPLKGCEGHKATVSNSFCRYLPKIFDDEGCVSIKVTEHSVEIADESHRIVGRQLMRDFLPYEKVLLEPKYYVELKRNEFISALRRATLFESVTSKSQKFSFNQDTLTISYSQPESSSVGKEEVSCINNGDPISLRFVSADLLGVMKTLEKDTVSIGIIGEHSPIRIDEDGFVFIIQCVLGG